MQRPIRQRLAHLTRTALACMLLSGFAVSAQAPGDIRVALVIGNAAYPGNAALANPGNDAKAMAVTLRKLGFTVVELRDGNKAQMAEAIAKVRDQLKGMQGIGMLYYAGHGLQLDWHNYMVPVDARLGKATDVPLQTVDVSAVIDAFKLAGNRMNILVLDACRDSPFAANGTASGKGLAQLDAPPGTFLAFATAPGNVAEDGDASSGNGLYTQYLLQELNRPIAKIEDVFKRVRLNVRQKSQGRQVPWESTSLEEDFFFNDGSAIKSEDLERQASEAKRREQQLLQKANEAREREKQIALALEKERQAQALAAKLAEEQRVAIERQAKEAERLAGVAREAELKRLAQEAKAREELRLSQEAQAKQRERQLAEQQAKEHTEQLALAQAQEAEARKQEQLRQVAAEAQAREAAKRLSKEQQRDQAFATEKAAWDKIKDSKNADDLYAFLRQFPNGSSTEIAQFQLDRIAQAKIDIFADKNGVIASPGKDRFKVGDYFEWSGKNVFGNPLNWKLRVTGIKGGEIQVNDGDQTFDLMGNLISNRSGVRSPARITVPSELRLYKSWRTAYEVTNTKGIRWNVYYDYKVVAFENLTVPAGTFKSFKITGQGWDGQPILHTYWLDANTFIMLKEDWKKTAGHNRPPEGHTRELQSLVRS